MRVNNLLLSIEDGCGVIITSRANIFYYSGFTSEDATLLITKTRRILVTDSRYTYQAKVEAPTFEIRNVSEGIVAIAKELDCESLCFEENTVTVSEFALFQKFGKKLIPSAKTIARPRYIKEGAEIEKIKKAEELASAAFDALLSELHTGMTENEVALFLEFYMRKNGASGLSFPTIVARGVRSCMPHGEATDKVIEAGDFVTIDFGCILDGYCSDMTRTVVMGKASERQKEIYDIVLLAQISAIDAIKVGKPCSEIDGVARKIITDAGYGENFGHSLGHSLGIEIHESPNFSSKSEDLCQIGNVITVEPGIYIDGFGGVRIEDVVVIGETVQNLTKSCKDFTII